VTGPEHWLEADRILSGLRCDFGCPFSGCEHEMAYLGRAEAHALLAIAAAVAGVPDPVRLSDDTMVFPRPGLPPPRPRPYIGQEGNDQ
jgi:hypothetical protein